MSKSKGSYWERKFVAAVQDAGLPARRVPLSGAMAHYKDDVVVCDEVRVECKYRRNGEGFSRLYGWIGGHSALELPESGLIVYRFGHWLELVRQRIDAENAQLELIEAVPSSTFVTKSVSEQKTLLGWLGEADCLGLRRAHDAWLVAERVKAK